MEHKEKDADLVDVESASPGEHDDLHRTTSDHAQLEAIGLKEELDRKFSVWSLGALVLCLMGTWEAIGSTMAQALITGGAPCLVYNYILCFFGSLCVVWSLGELASIYPTAGAQYHWVAGLAPLSTRKTASWFTGWITIGASICATASAGYLAAGQIRGLIALCDETYVPQPWHNFLLYCGVLLYSLAINAFGTGPLSTMNLVAGVLHISGLVAFIVTIGAMSEKASSHFVFVESDNYAGWSSDGLAWMIGMLSTAYSFLGYDAAAHLAEEIPHAARNVPLAMVGSTVFNGVVGFAYCIILLYSITDVATLLSTPTGFPFIQLFYNVTRSKAGAVIMTLVPTLIAMAGNAAALASASRGFWAFARDSALPQHNFWARVEPRFKIPMRMVLLVTFLEVLLGLISLGSATALNAILSMTVTGLYLTYAVPICYMLYARYNSVAPAFGPFRISPRFGAAVNILGLIYLVLVIFFSMWPVTYPVTSSTMNWAVVVLAGWVVLGAAYYFLGGRNKYKNPIVAASTLH